MPISLSIFNTYQYHNIQRNVFYFYFQNKARQFVHSFIVNIILFGNVIGCLVDTIITGFDKTINNFEKKKNIEKPRKTPHQLL